LPSNTRTVLAFDTSAAHCAAALLRGGEIVAERREAMARGQAERIILLLEELLEEGGVGWDALDAIGVGIGPGNFTGIRISVSAARGLALGLGRPGIGITRFETLHAAYGAGILPAVAAPQDRLYVQAPESAPALMAQDEAEELARELGLALTFESDGFNPAPYIAQLTAGRLDADHPRPAPLYIKAADAAPARDAAPILVP
jgi:tRNA threonylcarbamoyladenosine biosynthesis protein TsaB